MNKGKVIITAPVHEFLLKQLTEKGFEVDYSPSIGYTELCERIESAKGIVVTTRIKDRKSVV